VFPKSGVSSKGLLGIGGIMKQKLIGQCKYCKWYIPWESACGNRDFIMYYYDEDIPDNFGCIDWEEINE
jgi:hypothetical protein